MVLFFRHGRDFFTLDTEIQSNENIKKLIWLFGGVPNVSHVDFPIVDGFFVGPRKELVTPWSTNAVEIVNNMGISGVRRIERFVQVDLRTIAIDPMLEAFYEGLDQHIYSMDIASLSVLKIGNIREFKNELSLSLSDEELSHLEDLSLRMGRKLTDSEIFGFSQINSEHCRHKIFNGIFIIDGKEKKDSLFDLIRKTSDRNPDTIVSAYRDNVAFVRGPQTSQLIPDHFEKSSFYRNRSFYTVISLKAETHNFPTTVEPFSGAATGSGGEIRDRLAGGQGSIPLSGMAVYMTSYPRLEDDRSWEKIEARKWLYQSPVEILIKASDGASDFGNKFGQPLTCGALLTFEHCESGEEPGADSRILGFDKVIMLAGGVGYTRADQALKKEVTLGDKIVLLGGDNYRIGMGGASVSSFDTGHASTKIEWNAIQRSNPEMQKRVANTIRSMVESDTNPLISIHDHGAGGHLNCFSELVESEGGTIDLDRLPLGDVTLSAREIIGNESQERMGLIIKEKDLDYLKMVAQRERCPLFVVGEVTGDQQFTFKSGSTGICPINLKLKDIFGSPPTKVMKDETMVHQYEEITYDNRDVEYHLKNVLRLESVACKDWLTNKVDRSVGGKVAKQQCVGSLQLPLNDVSVMALDFDGKEGVATSIGHAPLSGLIDVGSGVRNAISECLTNLVWAPLQDGIASVSLSANWMWSCKTKGEDARLYRAVEAASEFAIHLGINIPTGKDSLSMKQKYPDIEVVAPGTVIMSSVAHCSDVRKIVEPVFIKEDKNAIYYIDLSCDAFKLGGSSLAQTLGKIGKHTPDVKNPSYFKKVFHVIQILIEKGLLTAGHDISAGGLITTLLEMCFSQRDLGAEIDLSSLMESDIINLLFSENAAVVIQTDEAEKVESIFKAESIRFFRIGKAVSHAVLRIQNHDDVHLFDIAEYRDVWYRTSYLLDIRQSGKKMARKRFEHYKIQPLKFVFPSNFDGNFQRPNDNKPIAAVLREKGSNSEREMANALSLSGFRVKDIHMTDLMTGRETLDDIQFLAVVGGFSNSDVLGSAKGWAGVFLYNERVKGILERFYRREDTLSLGICNGCQLLVELGLIYSDHDGKITMKHNDSLKHESGFVSVKIQKNNSIMLSSLESAVLGVWISHGEGKFSLPDEETKYNIVAKYYYDTYPGNPNGSDYNTAMMCSQDGRHLVTMPHIERSIFQWNWPNYPKNKKDQASPWIEAFINARLWLSNQKN